MKVASSTLEELSDGHFQPVIDDPFGSASGVNRMAVRRLILCTGKIAHELEGDERRKGRADLAIARVELLYPYPEDEIRGIIASYPNLERITWVQEEPRNMGAWEHMHRELSRTLPHGVRLEYVGRARRASSSEGYPKAHQTEQQRVIAAAFDQGSASE
jgi:2-oxoglutarate dehydrogenase E1 component